MRSHAGDTGGLIPRGYRYFAELFYYLLPILTFLQLLPDRFLEIIRRRRSPALFHSFAISGRARWRDTELLRVGLDFVEWLRLMHLTFRESRSAGVRTSFIRQCSNLSGLRPSDAECTPHLCWCGQRVLALTPLPSRAATLTSAQRLSGAMSRAG